MISVVIPTYNPNDDFFIVIESILSNINQIYDSEIIVVDDGSYNLDSLEIFEKVNSFDKVNVFRKANGGVSSARNYGVYQSKNELIAFCDSDDVWAENKIKIQMNLILEKKLKCIGAEKRFFKKSNDLVFLKIIDQLISWGPHISSVIISKKLFLSINGFDEKMSHAEDGDFYLKVINSIGNFPIVNKNMIHNVEEKIAYGVKGLSANLNMMFKGEVYAIKKNLKFFYWFFIVWIFLKYINRILRTKI